jgi:hypothetical protein
MSGSVTNAGQQLAGERRQVDCVEIYLPKSIDYLSELYRLLREKLRSRFGPLHLNGFSIYEVDGVFQGTEFWDQRTLVIRLLFIRPPGKPVPPVNELINLLGREIASKVAFKEEEIWICRYPQSLSIFRGLQRNLS